MGLVAVFFDIPKITKCSTRIGSMVRHLRLRKHNSHLFKSARLKFVKTRYLTTNLSSNSRVVGHDEQSSITTNRDSRIYLGWTNSKTNYRIDDTLNTTVFPKDAKDDK